MEDIDIISYLNELNDEEASEIDAIKELEEGDSRIRLLKYMLYVKP